MIYVPSLVNVIKLYYTNRNVVGEKSTQGLGCYGIDEVYEQANMHLMNIPINTGLEYEQLRDSCLAIARRCKSTATEYLTVTVFPERRTMELRRSHGVVGIDILTIKGIYLSYIPYVLTSIWPSIINFLSEFTSQTFPPTAAEYNYLTSILNGVRTSSIDRLLKKKGMNN